MQIIKHDYNGLAIPQRDDGYVSLTVMSQAGKKKVNDYLRLKSTKEYLEAFSESTGIPVDLLIVVNESEGSNDNRGTWAHPEIAIDFAKWVNVDFRIWANRTLRQVISEGSDSVALPVVKQSDAVEESTAIARSFSSLLSSANLGRNEAEKQNLLAGTSLTVMGMRHPELRGELMEYHKLLAASTPTNDLLLTPTVIGERLGLSARKVNKLLIAAGLQDRVPESQRGKGLPDYQPTAEGKRFAANTLSTGNSGDRSTYQHYKWSEEVMDVLSDFITQISGEAIA